jgi:hemin uptake protein HemP
MSNLPRSWRAPDQAVPHPGRSVAPMVGPQAGIPRLTSGQLFGQANEVHIEHAGSIYRLRITALGKLILTK